MKTTIAITTILLTCLSLALQAQQPNFNELNQELPFKQVKAYYDFKRTHGLDLSKPESILQKTHELDSTLAEKMLGASYAMDYKTIHSYSANGKSSNWDEYKYDNGNWRSELRYEFTYNANDYLIEKVTWRWDSGRASFDRELREEYTVDNFGQRLQYIISYWDISSSSWLLDTKYDYTYPGNDEVAIKSTWDAIGAAWDPEERRTETYDSWGDILASLTESWDKLNLKWLNVAKSDFYYSGIHNDEILSSVWDSTSNKWVNTWRALFDYDANDLSIRNQYFDWDIGTSSWVPNSVSYTEWNSTPRPIQFTDSTYDKVNKKWIPNSRRSTDWGTGTFPLSTTYWNYSTTSSTWVPADRYSFNYDNQISWQDLQNPGSWREQGDLFWSFYYRFNRTMPTYDIHEVYQSGNWQTDGRNTYYYNSLSSRVEYIDGVELSVFPNPSDGMLTLLYYGQTELQAQLLDLNGKRISNLRLSPGQQLSVTMPEASGVYLLQTSTNHRIQTIKVLKR